MNEISKNGLYLLNVSQDCKYNLKQWFRYLRKFITREKIHLTDKDIEMLLNSSELSNIQKVSLERALTKGSDTYEHVVSLNEKTKLENLRKFIKGKNDPKVLKVLGLEDKFN